jgi:hypothetical protein
MHPFLKDKRALALYLCSWSMVGLMLAAVLAVQGKFEGSVALAVILPPAMLYGFMCLSSWYLCEAFPLQQTDPAKLLPLFALAAFTTSSLWVLVSNGWAFLLDRLGVLPSLQNRFSAETPLLLGVGSVLFFLVAAIHYVVIAYRNAGETERKALYLTILARDAELKALRSQVDPHFLFNSLNSVSALTSTDPVQARAMILKLADFLRMTLNAGSRRLITIDEEIALVQNFLEIERVRFGSRLEMEFTIEGNTCRCAIAPLLLQPLVENAVNHGIAHLVDGGTIRIWSSRHGDQLIIGVENPVDAEHPAGKGNGLGLENVRQRLYMLHGNNARLDAAEHGNRFLVELSIPATESLL